MTSKVTEWTVPVNAQATVTSGHTGAHPATTPTSAPPHSVCVTLLVTRPTRNATQTDGERSGQLRTESSTQLPWKPKGTRCGRWIRATGSLPGADASRMTRSEESVGRVVHETDRPALVFASSIIVLHEDELTRECVGPRS